MLRTKINVNLGVSRDCKDYNVEMEKVTVSYTHLDVYKRQLYSTPQTIPAMIMGTPMTMRSRMGQPLVSLSTSSGSPCSA